MTQSRSCFTPEASFSPQRGPSRQAALRVGGTGPCPPLPCLIFDANLCAARRTRSHAAWEQLEAGPPSGSRPGLCTSSWCQESSLASAGPQLTSLHQVAPKGSIFCDRPLQPWSHFLLIEVNDTPRPVASENFDSVCPSCASFQQGEGTVGGEVETRKGLITDPAKFDQTESHGGERGEPGGGDAAPSSSARDPSLPLTGVLPSLGGTTLLLSSHFSVVSVLIFLVTLFGPLSPFHWRILSFASLVEGPRRGRPWGPCGGPGPSVWGLPGARQAEGRDTPNPLCGVAGGGERLRAGGPGPQVGT